MKTAFVIGYRMVMAYITPVVEVSIELYEYGKAIYETFKGSEIKLRGQD